MPETLRGGGSVGSSKYLRYHASWPLVSLTIDFDSITFKIFPCAYKFEREHIQHLVEEKFLWFPQLRIVHTKAEAPKSVIFGTLNFSNLKEILGRYNYRVESNNDIEYEDKTIKHSKAVETVGIISAGVSVLAGIGGLLAALLALKILAPVKKEAQQFATQTIAIIAKSGDLATVASYGDAAFREALESRAQNDALRKLKNLGALKTMANATCDSLSTGGYDNLKAALRGPGRRTTAHCYAKIHYEHGDVAVDLWLNKNQTVWRISRFNIK